MIMISFRTKRDKEDMIEKARQMEKFAAEFVDCLESSEEEYYDEDERYSMRDNMSMRDGMHMRGGARMRNRYSYK